MRLAIFEIVAVLAIVGILGSVFIGNRPDPDRFFSVNGLEPRTADLDHVRAVLRRTRRSRLAGALVGLLLGGLTGASLGTAGSIAGAGIGLLAGTMLGITTAQLRPQAPPEPTRTASLNVRDARDYLPRRAHAVTVGVAAGITAFGTFAIAMAALPMDGATTAIFGIGFATLLAVPIGWTFQRRTVELRRPDDDAASVCVDDALRACALRGIHHATVGVLMCGLLLVGYGAVTTQNITTVKVGGRTVLRAPAASMMVTPDPFAVPNPRRYVAEWTAGGSQHTRVIHTGGRTLTVSSFDNGLVLGIAYWFTVIGFFGALIEWGRAAKSWRRPQTTPKRVEATV